MCVCVCVCVCVYGGVEPPTKFSKKREGLDRTSVFRGGCRERGGGWGGGGEVTSGRGFNFSTKNKLKSGVFNDKKSLQIRMLRSVVTKNSNRNFN